MKFSEAFTALYDVKQVLGEGGMGRVLLAEDRALQRLVAIKLLADFDDGPDGMLRQRFDEEARVCASFKHPNVVRMFSSGFEGGKPYMVFEYIEGGDLARRLEGGQLPVDEALAITDAVLQGLEYAHEHKVVHRDVKPANIILRADGGDAMLMDFGIARATSGRTFKTQANLILGTPLYMAPELINRASADRGVDIYALGCTLYEMLAGRPPYNGRSDVIILEMHLHGTPEPLRAIRSDVPEDVELLIEKAMHKQPERRFQSAREMSGWIDTIRGGGRVPRARTVPQMAAPGGATTRPDVVSPAGRTPRGASSRGVPSRGAVSRGTAPAGVTRMLSQSEPMAGADGASGRGKRIAVAAGVLALLAGGGWAGWRAAANPSDVKLEFASKGLEVSWRTMRPTRGAVYTKAQEAFNANPDGTLDRPPVHAQLTPVQEEAATGSHKLLVPNLRPGDSLVVSVAGPSGESAWARVVLVPPAAFARQLPGDPGASATRVVAPTGRVASATLEARPVTGEMVAVRPAAADVAELTFDVPLAPELLTETSLVRAEQLPGVTIALPVRTMLGHVERLSDALDRVHVTEVIQQLIRDKKFDKNSDFDNMLGETPMYDGMPKQVARRLAPEGYFRDQLTRLLKPSRLMEALEEFRPHAAGWFSASGVSDEHKLRIYDRLMLLEQLDQLIRGQYDSANQIGFAKYYESFVKARYTVAPANTPLVAPPTGATIIEPGGHGWISRDYVMWKTLAAWTRDYGVYRGMLGGPWMKPEEVRTAFPDKREFKVAAVPGAGGAGTVHLRGTFAIFGPNYFWDLCFKVPKEFHVRIAQPATPEWRKAMDDAGSMEPVPPHGTLEITFPARLLPADSPFTVEMQYRLLPSAKIDDLQALQRGAISRDLSIRVE